MLDAGYNPDDENNSYQTKIFPKLIPTLIENSNPKCLDIGTAQGHVPICLYKRGIKNWDVIDYDDIYFSDFSDKSKKWIKGIIIWFKKISGVKEKIIKKLIIKIKVIAW